MIIFSYDDDNIEYLGFVDDYDLMLMCFIYKNGEWCYWNAIDYVVNKKYI
jgi:hypothetical protein